MNNLVALPKQQIVGTLNITNEVLMPVAKARNFAGKICHDTLGLTLSLAYYTVVMANVKPFKTSNKGLLPKLHGVFRQFIAAKYNETTGLWSLDSEKAKKLQKKLNIKFKDCSFEDFKVAMTKQVETVEAAKQEKIAEEEALSPVEAKAKDDSRIVKYLVKNFQGMTEEHIQDLVIQAKKELAEIQAA